MNRFAAFVRWLVTLEDVRWFAHRVGSQLLDEPEERWRAARLLTQVLGAGAVTGWIIATFLSAGAGISTLPGATTDPLNVIAREPGPAYNVLAFCNDPATKVELRIDPQVVAPRLIARRGGEEINWIADPNTPTAMRYWVTPNGTPAADPVEVTKAAGDCLRKKGGIR